LLFSYYFQVVSISEGHTCTSASKVLSREATKEWIADKAKDILRIRPTMGPKKLQEHLEGQFPVKIAYTKV